MNRKFTTSAALSTLLADPRVDRTRHDGQTYYKAADVMSALVATLYPDDAWNDLKKRDHALGRLAERLESTHDDGTVVSADFVDLTGVLRIVQSVESPRAERIKRWLAETGVQRLREAKNPELAVLRARKEYEAKGHDRRWIDKRVRGISARHEVTSEWARRGATESEQYRGLTNEINRAAFGLDVEGHRRYKGLTGSTRNLRDHMSDLELVLTQLGEATAVALHQRRDSHGFDQLVRDARDAGEIVGQARRAIEASAAREGARMEH